VADHLNIASLRPPATRKRPPANRHVYASATSLRLAALSNASLPPTGSRLPLEPGKERELNQNLTAQKASTATLIGHLTGHVTPVWGAA
jgi:hypothetical protein